MARYTSAVVLLLAAIVATEASAQLPNFPVRNASSNPSLIIGGFLPPPVPPPPPGQVHMVHTAVSSEAWAKLRDWASMAGRGRLLLSGSFAHASLETAVQH